MMKNQDIAKNKSVKNPFSDTADESVISLYNYAIINGKNENEFYPYDYITREEFAKILSGTYNKLNRLTEYNNGITSVHYAYNPSGLRKTKTQGEVTTNYYWNGSNLTYESKTNGEKNYYYYDVTGILSANFNGTVNNFLKDSHANVVSLLDSDGNVIRNYAYDAFGNEQTENDADINPFRYCGEYMDLSSGLIYLRNRYYDPATSRMLSEDPARAGTNWYIYCNNNPVKYVDPSGLDAIVITTSTMSVYGNAHTSVLAQDNGGNWYYFYWGNKNAVLLEVPADKLTDLGTFNAWLVENGAGKAGEKTDKPLHDSSDEYTTGTYIEGDFSASVSYFLEQAIGANMSEEIKDGKHEYKNNSYGLFGNNCMTVSFGGLKKGTLTDGTNFGDFAKFDGAGSIRPNDFRVMIRETFANQEFTRSSARNSAIGNIGVKKPRYMSQNYYNQGQKYGKMLRGY